MMIYLVILSVAKNPKNLRYALFLDTSLALSMTRLISMIKNKQYDKENQFLRFNPFSF